MAERPILCHPTDALLQIDPSLSNTDVETDAYIGNEDSEILRSRIDNAAAEFEERTGHAMRLNRRGSPGASETFEYQERRGNTPTAPIRVRLDYRPVLPFDSNSNDTLEVRTGKNSWDDITDSEGDEFTLDNRKGRLRIYRRVLNRVYWKANDNRYLRATYRYGILGGSQYEGGQTTLDGQIAQDDTSISVTNAARLPNRGKVLIENQEYARITDVNYSTNTLTVIRGEDLTMQSDHPDGSVVHFCPESVRTAVASNVAVWALNNEHWIDRLVDTGHGIDLQRKKEDLQAVWEKSLANHSDVRMM